MGEDQFTTEELQNEEWRDVVGYEGTYSVSNLGRVRREIGFQCRTPRLLKPGLSGGNYFTVALCQDGIQRSFTVHALVAAAFFGKCPKGKSVNHESGIKTDNRSTNLNYKTPKEQMEHAGKYGLIPIGDRNGARKHPERVARGDRSGFRKHPECFPHGEDAYNAKLKNAEIPRIFKLRKQGLLLREIGAKMGVSKSHIGRILRGQVRKPYEQKNLSINKKTKGTLLLKSQRRMQRIDSA